MSVSPCNTTTHALFLKAGRAALLGNTGYGVCASSCSSAFDPSGLLTLSIAPVDTLLLPLLPPEGGYRHVVNGDRVLLVLGPSIGVGVRVAAPWLLSLASKPASSTSNSSLEYLFHHF